MAGWSSFFICLALTGHFLYSPLELLYLLLPVAVWYSTMPFAMMDEIRCDQWAAKNLRDRYGVSRPSQVLAKAMDFPPRHLDFTDRVLKRLLDGIHADYHPTKEKRIELIAENIDGRELGTI